MSDMATRATPSRGYSATKEQLIARLRRIEGQVRGVQKMVDEDRYCIDVVTQISAIEGALEKVALGLLDEHARHCVMTAEDGTARSGPKSSSQPSDACSAAASPSAGRARCRPRRSSPCSRRRRSPGRGTCAGRRRAPVGLRGGAGDPGAAHVAALELRAGLFDVKRKVAERERVFAGGRDVIVVFGGVRSIDPAGDRRAGSTFIAASVARTSKVWTPAARATGNDVGRRARREAGAVVRALEGVAAGLVRGELERREVWFVFAGGRCVIDLGRRAVGDGVERAEELEAAVGQHLEVGARVDGVQERGLELRDGQRQVARQQKRRGAGDVRRRHRRAVERLVRAAGGGEAAHGDVVEVDPVPRDGLVAEEPEAECDAGAAVEPREVARLAHEDPAGRACPAVDERRGERRQAGVDLEAVEASSVARRMS